MEFKIIKDYGNLNPESTKKMNLHLTEVEWGDYKAKFDLRTWSEDFKKCGKGTTLKREELKNLRDILNKLDL